MRLVLGLVLLVSCSGVGAAPRVPLLVVTDGVGTSMPAGVRERLAGWSYDTCAPPQVTADKLAGYRTVLWASGDNPRPFWPLSAKAVLAGFMQKGGSVAITGDHDGEWLASSLHGDLVKRWARSAYRGRLGTRRLTGGDDWVGVSGPFGIDGYGADAYEKPSGAVDSRTILLDPATYWWPVGFRVSSRDWPSYRLALIGVNVGRIPLPVGRIVVDRLMRWMDYPAREDFERVVALARAGQDTSGAEARARVTLACQPAAVHDFLEVLAATPSRDRAVLLRLRPVR